jgi:hypothetical protein
MTNGASKSEMLENLRVLLSGVLSLHDKGAVYSTLAHAQGVVDGYMRFLLDAKVCTQRELLALVKEQRCAVDGPAVSEIDQENNIVAA